MMKTYLKISGVAAVVAMMGCADAMAVPAYRGGIQFQRPDGTEITLYRSGDENFNQLRDADGRLMILDDNGYAIPADVEAHELLRAASQHRKKYLFSGNAFPCEGAPHAIVVLAEYPDTRFSMDDPLDFYTRQLNEVGYGDYDATGSARDFFVDNSNGRFTPTFDVYGPVQMKNAMSYYGRNDAWGNDQHPEEVVIECLEALDSKVDFTQYDHDGDGYIDNVFVIYAGYGEADSNMRNTIWPHSADLSDYELGVTYKFDGKILNRYGMTNEIDGSYRRPDGIGTFVHEFSHVLGLPDLYTTVYNSAFTPGEYCTLDYGPYNNAGRTPPYYSIFERMSLGWCEPVELTESGDYTLNTINNSNTGFIVRTDKDNEFFLFENRQQTGSDKYIPGHGMLVWHIDFNQKVWDDNVVNNTPSHQYVDIVEADNRRTDQTRDADPFPGTKNVTEFNDTKLPHFVGWSGKTTGVALSDIREADGLVHFHAEVSQQTGIGSGFDASAPLRIDGDRLVNAGEIDCTVYDISGRRVAVVAAGEAVTLPSGIYVAKAGEKTLRLKI